LLQKFRDLTKGVAIYGAGDVAIQVVNFLLLRVYVLYLTKIDYGVLALLAGVEGPIKFFRWGIDGLSCATGTTARTIPSDIGWRARRSSSSWE
jgi:hypothetical protein